ncbi:alpha/beta fold hydrolase [Jiangella endophytica]|uniref:alpha/beta fold hydrolase n=1 Tax=Jiangella endophytica TaxID=1623398 RepID=UPI000E346FEF|nr:alpha/beta hydrolase [Jiangella endophytica]
MATIRGATGNALYYEDSGGPGRPVVLIHGWPLSGRMWQPQAGPLAAAGYRVVAYDRRGFGESDKPQDGYDYNTLAADLAAVMDGLDLRDATLVGFSMGGGEVARYLTVRGVGRVRSVVFASAVTPYLLRTDDNPDGPLTRDEAEKTAEALAADRERFFDGLTRDLYTAGGELRVSENVRRATFDLCRRAGKVAALETLAVHDTTDFRADVAKVAVPALVLHGDADRRVPFEGSGRRTHEAIEGSELVLVEGGPHGMNVSHAPEVNRALLAFLSGTEHG